MCGRVTIRTLGGEIFDAFSITEYHFREWRPRYNLPPGDEQYVIRLGRASQPEVARLRWGLVPSWTNDPTMGYRMFNARCETVAQKAGFRDAFAARRCLVLVDGWFEWRKEGRIKIPTFLHYPDDRLFALAGLWEPTETCTILTTAAPPRLFPVHDRAPLIVPPTHLHAWLEGNAGDVLAGLIASGTHQGIEARVVSTRVNTPASDDPECLEAA
jgi:putative SOS response-associated peptidase YedK